MRERLHVSLQEAAIRRPARHPEWRHRMVRFWTRSAPTSVAERTTEVRPIATSIAQYAISA